jgi:hypothetical protein
MCLADTNSPSGKKFEVENFQLLAMIVSKKFLSVEMFLEWQWAFTSCSNNLLSCCNSTLKQRHNTTTLLQRLYKLATTTSMLRTHLLLQEQPLPKLPLSICSSLLLSQNLFCFIPYHHNLIIIHSIVSNYFIILGII